MIIKPEHFENGGEVDFGVWHREPFTDRQYRLSVRQIGDEVYEAYGFFFDSRREKTIFIGTLRDVVSYINGEYGYDDEVVE